MQILLSLFQAGHGQYKTQMVPLFLHECINNTENVAEVILCDNMDILWIHTSCHHLH